MSYELKRVPLDFNAPLNKVWQVNVYETDCPICGGNGQSREYATLQQYWYESTLPGDNNLPAELVAQLFNRPAPWKCNLDEVEVELLSREGRLFQVPLPHTAKRVNRWAKNDPFGHDTLTMHLLIKRHLDTFNLPSNCINCNGEGVMTCPACGGVGTIGGDRCEACYHPIPTGDGYQVWETVSEGSPISPVFATPDAVVDWLVAAGYTRAGSQKFVKMGWSPSGIMVAGHGYVGAINCMEYVE